MSDLSNLYVEKINSEHPLAVWMLNEEIDYVSLIDEEQRQLYNTNFWTVQGGVATASGQVIPLTPFVDSATSKISGDIPSGPGSEIVFNSVFPVPLEKISEELANFSLSFHLFTDSPYLELITFGYQYYDPIAEITEFEVIAKEVGFDQLGQWSFLANTFQLPPANAQDIVFVIKIKLREGGSAGDYDFFFNGITLGQWSEEFHRSSLGLTPTPIPEDIALDVNMQVTPAFPYGSSVINGYYTSCQNDRRIYSVNFGIPLVYGSENTTKIYPHQHLEEGKLVTYPSLIFPGYGFLNESGRYNEYTAELWVRINTDAIEPRKFFGPISGNDGLYVEGGFLTFVVGKKYGSHYVGEWFRPMLIHIRYIRNNVTVLVNGEEVISIDFVDSEIVLPSSVDSQGRSQDWLGFYAYQDVRPIDIDSLAIYSYSVPNEVAKRRWVWGQGVVAPETTNSALNAQTAFTDYSFAKYTSNYNYPDIANWRQAFFSNVNTSSSLLSLPEYEFPVCTIPERFTEEQWMEQLQASQSQETDKYFSFRPNEDWDGENTYAYLEKFGVLTEAVESFYMVAQSDGLAENQTLFKAINKFTGDFLICKVDGNYITYNANIAGEVFRLGQREILADTKFTAGINISKISLRDVPGINRFFSDQDIVELYLCGDAENPFTGRVYRAGFDAAYNNRKIDDLYDEDGLFDESEATADKLMRHVANYTAKAYEKYGLFFNDIAVAGYWEDYMPLSYFGKNVSNFRGQTSYDVDGIQVNLDYPEGLEINALESISSWTYGDLRVRYQSPVQLQYKDLSNNFYTGWDDYEDMAQDSEKYYYYNTEESAVRSYVSFQYIKNGANKNLVDFEKLAVPRVGGVVSPEKDTDNWEQTAFEVVDGTIVYPPRVNLNEKPLNPEELAIVYHLDFASEGIKHHPIRFRDFQLASQVLERAIFTEIGTKFGTPAFPYKRLGLFFDFKGDNPISIYKESTPYLFMNRHSGFRVRGSFTQKPQNQISTVTGAIGNGTTVTYQSVNSFVAGQRVTITGLSTASGSSLNLANVVISQATPTSFRVENSTIGISSGRGVATVIFAGFIVVERGIAIPVNPQRALDTEVSAVQIWMRFAERVFPSEEIPIFSIDYNDGSYQFFLVQDESQQRGKIIARDRFGRLQNGIRYYVNGKLVDVPYINNEEWGVLGVAFAEPLSFSGRVGRLNLNGPLTYNNISYYLSSDLERAQRLSARNWLNVQQQEGEPIEWGTWRSEGSWTNVQVISSTDQYAIDPADVYQRYVGTNRIIVDDNVDGLVVDPDALRVYSDVTWSTSTRTPV